MPRLRRVPFCALAAICALLLVAAPARSDEDPSGQPPAPEEGGPPPFIAPLPEPVEPEIPAPLVVQEPEPAPPVVEAPPAPSVRPRIAVLPFVDPKESAGGEILSTFAISDILTTELARTGRFTIVERKEGLKALLDNVQVEGATMTPNEQSAAMELYRLTGADYLLVGRISSAHFESTETGTSIGGLLDLGGGKREYAVKVDFRLLRAITGEVVYATRGEGSSKRGRSLVVVAQLVAVAKDRHGNSAGQYDLAVLDAVINFVDQLETTDLFPVRAEIQGITESDEVFIDLGQSSGIFPGLELNCRRAIIARDAKSGRILGQRYSDILGVLEVEEVNLDYAICRIKSGRIDSDCLVELPEGVSLADHLPAKYKSDKK